MKKIIGKLKAKNIKIIILSSKYNSEIVEMLFDGAIDAFCKYGGDINNITRIEVPGAFEIPSTINQIIKNMKMDAILTLGSIIRGGTPHFDYVAGESSKGISTISMNSNIPIIFGILTTNNIEEAQERASTKAGNKGWELMESTLQTISVYKQIETNKN
tara:strand:+ start:354 stop:830 length:477 start_codon:yes stop_codon:yes gene_type:complete